MDHTTLQFLYGVTAPKEGFEITDDNTADWAVRKIQEDEAERDRLIKLAKDQINELKNRIVELEEACESKTGYLKSLLAAYFETVPHRETETQESYKLLSGKLIKKKAKFDYEYDDEKLAQFLADEKKNEFLNIKVTPKWGEFKKTLAVSEDGQVYIEETGELVDVITAVEVPPQFTVK